MNTYLEYAIRVYYVYYIVFNYAHEHRITVNEASYDRALAHEKGRCMKMFEELVNLCFEQMDLGLPNEGLSISATDRAILLSILKKNSLC